MNSDLRAPGDEDHALTFGAGSRRGNHNPPGNDTLIVTRRDDAGSSHGCVVFAENTDGHFIKRPLNLDGLQIERADGLARKDADARYSLEDEPSEDHATRVGPGREAMR